jgi:hypothetical protein
MPGFGLAFGADLIRADKRCPSGHVDLVCFVGVGGDWGLTWEFWAEKWVAECKRLILGCLGVIEFFASQRRRQEQATAKTTSGVRKGAGGEFG